MRTLTPQEQACVAEAKAAVKQKFAGLNADREQRIASKLHAPAQVHVKVANAQPPAPARASKPDEVQPGANVTASPGEDVDHRGYDLPVHPAADAFPMMSELALGELAQDIRERGLQHPISTRGGVVIDGRNRLRACKLAGIKPVFIECQNLSDRDVVSHIISVNIHRRHLSDAQRESIAARLATMRPGNAKAQRGSDVASCDISCEEAARRLGVSKAGVVRMKAVQKEAPELAKKIDAGEKLEGAKLTSSRAYKLAKLATAQKQADQPAAPAAAIPAEPVIKPDPAVLASLIKALESLRQEWEPIWELQHQIGDEQLNAKLKAMLLYVAKKGVLDPTDVIHRAQDLAQAAA